jgi:predicted TIM-barrel fold metal-dependent hydrolase
MTVFDIHPHVISADHERYPFDGVHNKQEAFIKERPVTTEGLLAQMDAAGVEHAALVQMSLAYGYDNSYVADSAAAYPERFASVCSVDVRAPDAPGRLRYWIRERGMDGLRVFASFGTMAQDSDWLADPVTAPAWEAALELGIPVCVMMKSTSFPVLGKVLERYPGLRIVLDHLGAPPTDDGPPFHGADGLWALAGRRNLYLKLTSSVLGRLAKIGASAAFVRRVIDVFGADSIAWGSNLPTSEGTLGELVAFAQEQLAPLSTAEREAIFNGTARSLYPKFALAHESGGRPR